MEEITTRLIYTKTNFTSASINYDDDIALGEGSNITITLSNSFSLYSSFYPSLTTLLVTIPSGFTISDACTATGGGTCSKVTPAMYRVANVGLSLTNFSITMENLIPNYFDNVSDTFKVVYLYDSDNVSVLDSGLTLSVFCDPPCQRCNGSPTNCESCLPPEIN